MIHGFVNQNTDIKTPIHLCHRTESQETNPSTYAWLMLTRVKRRGNGKRNVSLINGAMQNELDPCIAKWILNPSSLMINSIKLT